MSGTASNLLPLRIRLPYTTEEEFIDKYGSNVARGGVFVATRAMKPEGTGLAFEFVLADGTRLIRGEGVVVKAQVDTVAGRTGMTVRFVKLDAASKALVDRVVARRTGGAEPPQSPAQAHPTPPAHTPPPGLVRRATGARPSNAVRAAVPSPSPSRREDGRTEEASTLALTGTVQTAPAGANAPSVSTTTPDAEQSPAGKETAADSLPDATGAQHTASPHEPNTAPGDGEEAKPDASSRASNASGVDDATALPESASSPSLDSAPPDEGEQLRHVTPRFESDSSEGLDFAIAARLAETETDAANSVVGPSTLDASGKPLDALEPAAADTSKRTRSHEPSPPGADTSDSPRHEATPLAPSATTVATSYSGDALDTSATPSPPPLAPDLPESEPAKRPAPVVEAASTEDSPSSIPATVAATPQSAPVAKAGDKADTRIPSPGSEPDGATGARPLMEGLDLDKVGAPSGDTVAPAPVAVANKSSEHRAATDTHASEEASSTRAETSGEPTETAHKAIPPDSTSTPAPSPSGVVADDVPSVAASPIPSGAVTDAPSDGADKEAAERGQEDSTGDDVPSQAPAQGVSAPAHEQHSGELAAPDTRPPPAAETAAHESSRDGAGASPSSDAVLIAPATSARAESTADADAPRNRRRALFEVPVPAPVSPLTSPEVVLGIDLGTTHARVAIVQDGTPKLIPIPAIHGTDLPALIAVNGTGELVVGAAAQAEGARAPRRAIPGLKRLLGLRPRSPQLRWLTPLLPYPVATDANGDAAVEVRGRVISPTLFLAMLLRELKQAAAAHLGRKPTRAVICAPTHFTDRQCAALREAATLAGLDAQRILIAPAAAALAYAHGRGLARKRVLVVDLGGGGLQVCVVQVTGDDLEVITTGGDPALGGMDFDARIAEALASDLSEQGVPKPDHPLDWVPLRATAESTKVALSTQDQVDVTLPSGTVPPFSRERVEALTADLAQRVTTVVRDVLDSNALSPQGLDAVLLVGGQSATPMVRRRLEESLGVSVRDDVDAKNSVALGAALLGQGLLLAEAGKPAATVSEVLSLPLAVAERGGTLRRVLERNTRLPATKTLVLPCAPGPLEVALFQGTAPQAADAEYLGRLALNVERAGEVELHLTLSADGALSLEATLPGVKRHAVSLSSEPLDDAAFDALIARSPWAPAPEPRPGGLLSGLKKLFGRR